MPSYKIRGIDVDFPFEAYDCQIVYMEKVIQSLQNKCNALLESPTGTGKTLCLLCSTLAWRESLGSFSTRRKSKGFDLTSNVMDESPSQSEAKNLPTIIYTSRTHSQLRQVIQELKRTKYRPKMAVLGSREQLCIHDEVRLLRGRAQTNACHSLCKKGNNRRCFHHTRVADFMKKNPSLGDDPVDIEDLVNIGRSEGPCPYYVSRELHKVVDIVFGPYNYLIDQRNRKSLSIQWENSILIFDEAHNLESICADAASFDLSAGLLTACISEAKKCIDLCLTKRAVEKADDKSLNPDNFAILRALLLKLEKQIAEVPVQSKEFGYTRPGPYIYELLADLNITHETATMLINTIDEAALLLEEANGRFSQNTKGTVCRLESISDILSIIFRDGDKAHANSYSVHVQEVELHALYAPKGKSSRMFSWWCFNPGIAMQEFSKLGIGSIILTSGTLSPLDSFAQELKLEFPVQLENPHVISSNQIWAGVVPTGPSGFSFNSSYRNRDSVEYKQELGNAIVNFARIVPDGLLVFFPSYYILDQCIGCWKNSSNSNSTNSSTIWERICKHKQPVVEPKQSSLFSSSIEDFMTKLNDASSSGAVFFAVCRGKVSEGLDFTDHAGRAVVITGVPFAMRTDPKIRLKREYLDRQAQLHKEYKVLTGEDWYNQQASRAVNQAVGRVIRHRHDYGAIIFCDERFAQSSRLCQMSRWLQPHIKCYSKFGDVVYTLTRFFRDGALQDLTNPKSIQKGSIGHANIAKIPQPLDSDFPTKSLTSLVNTTSMDEDCSNKSLSSVLATNRGKTSSQLCEIIPANRSTLMPYKNKHLKLSRELLWDEKKLLMSGTKGLRYKNCEVTDITSNSSDEEQQGTAELIVTCSSKKPKILETEPEKHEKQPHLSACISKEISIEEGNRSMQHNPIGTAVLLEGDIATQKADFEFLAQKDKSFKSSHAPCVDEEMRGSAFLIQVQEKLTAAEYKEFVGFMKALKSKTMKISQALQSIARLFSVPDRHFLLRRFKDYIPTKYQPAYEQHLRSLGSAVGNGSQSLGEV